MEPCPSPSWQQSFACPAKKVMRPDSVISPPACRAQSLCGRITVAGSPSEGPAIAQGQWLAGGHAELPQEPLWSSFLVSVSTDPGASAEALHTRLVPEGGGGGGGEGGDGGAGAGLVSRSQVPSPDQTSDVRRSQIHGKPG
eukprot:COSAG02_NODE_10970_length_1821_cov_1.308362_2_plen_141_part_00